MFDRLFHSDKQIGAEHVHDNTHGGVSRAKILISDERQANECTHLAERRRSCSYAKRCSTQWSWRRSRRRFCHLTGRTTAVWWTNSASSRIWWKTWSHRECKTFPVWLLSHWTCSKMKIDFNSFVRERRILTPVVGYEKPNFCDSADQFF